MSTPVLADPREWRVAPTRHPHAAKLIAAVEAAISTRSSRDADVFEANARALIESMLASDAGALAEAFAHPPSTDAAKRLRKVLADVERGSPEASGALRATLFAIPLILVTALESGARPVSIAGVLSVTPALADMLRSARAFNGCETFALAPSLVTTDAVDVPALAALLARRSMLDLAGASPALDLPPARLHVDSVSERVQLRFIAGVVLAPPRIDPLRDADVGRWGIGFSQALTRALRAPGASLLAIPRAPSYLVKAVETGRAASREVAAQLFASNAIRKLRASYGEPTAIVSVHRSIDADVGGELRLSLSSPFAPREAEGFRCPIYPYETVQDVAAMLDSLLADCRVSDVRWTKGVHADIDPATGGPLFFKDTGASPDASLH